MAAYFNSNIVGPQIHVLLIGVGGYPYLKGGTNEQEQAFDSAQLLGQLTSPAASIEAVYNTILELNQSARWKQPLGSVDVLVSPAPGNVEVFAGKEIERATKMNIENAYWRWKQRCEFHEDNIALFYYCGHGLEKAEHYLLAEDFGRIPQNPWNESFAFDSTRRAFHKCKAKTQIFLVDACRQITSDMLTIILPMNPIDNPDLSSADCKYNLTQKATAANEGAYGYPNQPSFYAKALIAALEGKVADNVNGEWKISTGGLAVKMNRLLQMYSPYDNPAQRCINYTSEFTDIIKFSKPPTVRLNISCTPLKALKVADLSYKNLQTSIIQSRPPHASPWEIDVAAGIYHLQAIFSKNQYRDTDVLISIEPPLHSQDFKCINP